MLNVKFTLLSIFTDNFSYIIYKIPVGGGEEKGKSLEVKFWGPLGTY